MDTSDQPPQKRASSDSKEESGFNPLTAAALVGGAVAAGAGAYLGTRALARRNREKDGRPINSVMATAITACDLAHDKEPAVATEPVTPSEPKV
ncbi:MAG TPA: hypothetical protein VF582_08340 [Allosphingosinicella sp.]